MCRSIEDGGRRCPSCSGYSAAARMNSNKARNRKVRALVVAHLKEQGLVETAAAVQQAAPSMMPELMQELGIDQSILGGLALPSTHMGPPSAAALIEQAAAEREALANPDQADLAAARAALNAATTDAEEARKAVGRARYQLNKAKSSGDADEIAAAQADVDKAKTAHVDALAAVATAEKDVLIAEFRCRGDLDDEARDAYLAGLSADDQNVIADAETARHRDAAREALVTSNPIGISDTDRDTSIYTAGTFEAAIDGGDMTVEGRVLDGGTAIYRSSYGNFLVLQDPGNGVYEPVATAVSKADALAKANRIPIFTGLTNPGPDADPMDKQVAESNRAVVTAVAKAAIDGTISPEQARQRLTDQLDTAANDLADSLGGSPVRNEIHDATSRHKKRIRERAAEEAGAAARAAALAAGASSEDAETAYRKARLAKLGTPTIGGGVIPLFDHKIPPESLGEAKYASLTRSGVRAFGKESAHDYSVIADRAGNPSSWGFSTSSAGVKLSSISTLSSDFEPYMKQYVNSSQRSALRTYTGSSYREINAAITGRDANPSPSTAATVKTLNTAFEQFAENNTNTNPMTVMRGTRVPSGWKGSRDEYLASAFTVGAKVQMGKVTSTTTKASMATQFAQSVGSGAHPAYLMVIRTRHGMPVKSLSAHSSEDEVIVPPGSDLRCVHIDHQGVGGLPTVYLVAEDLVAEANDGTAA
ncbi:ADP-ribosyltransferase domain-containing protein [Rhodococcus sp. (in: high G+C Gram-positive bacteria)]|uniref:ADP-ribosyltransferase domain-containing protein n=1 Tax=Rhodococcus sp. TaxID=1831 RepID=UPI003B8A899A